MPAADVLDVDFADGTPTERVRNLAVKTFGSPTIAHDNALDRDVVTFDGNDAYGYALTPHWGEISNAVSIECTFRYDGTLPRSTEAAVCSGKEGGGYSIYINEDKVGLMAHIGGGYKTARTVISPNRWYHVVGTWDGSNIRLYVDGELAATTPATGALTLPASTARAWTLGADSSPNAGAQFYTTGRLANARLYGRALTADEVKALDIKAIGEHPDAGVALTSSVPAAGAHLSQPVELELAIANEDNATGWTYRIDGEPVAPGQLVGPGLAAGDHVLSITATDVFGKAVSFEVPFTSDAIPTGGGTDQGEGNGVVQLSAIATSPDGSDVTTTFREATATVAEGGVQGVVTAVPTTLDFTYEEGASLEGEQAPDDDASTRSPSSGDIPFQRYDVEVGPAVTGQQVVWKGAVDPERAVSLRAWSTATSSWVQLATARGVRDGDTVLNGIVRSPMVDGGTVHLLVLGTDPFADDLAPRDASAGADKDHFEDPADYDFSLAHFTDTQYLAEGAAGGTYDDLDGTAEASDVMQEEERAIWAAAYNAEHELDRRERGVPEDRVRGPHGRHHRERLLRPAGDQRHRWAALPGPRRPGDAGVRVHVQRPGRTLDDAGIVNQVIAGNHDNQLGQETGPTSRFNKYYGPGRYYDAATSWPAGASYHAWDETTDSAGNVATPGQDNQNNYVLFSAGGLDFVAVGLSYGVTQAEADWASSVFARYPDRNGILLTHAYIAPSTAADGRGASFSGDGSKLYDEVVEANPNVFLILAGHEHGVGTNLKTGVGASVHHNVVELLADYQFYKVPASQLWPDKVDAGGNIDLNGDGVSDHKATDLLQFGASWLRLLQFDVDRAEVSIDTYSPHFDNFGATEYDDRRRYNGAEDNLTLPVDLTTRTTSFATDGLTVVTPTDTVIGEDTARSGWPATVEWAGLAEGEVYAWTAESRTTSGEQVGSIRQFGTVFRATAARHRQDRADDRGPGRHEGHRRRRLRPAGRRHGDRQHRRRRHRPDPGGRLGRHLEAGQLRTHLRRLRHQRQPGGRAAGGHGGRAGRRPDRHHGLRQQRLGRVRQGPEAEGRRLAGVGEGDGALPQRRGGALRGDGGPGGRHLHCADPAAAGLLRHHDAVRRRCGPPALAEVVRADRPAQGQGGPAPRRPGDDECRAARPAGRPAGDRGGAGDGQGDLHQRGAHAVRRDDPLGDGDLHHVADAEGRDLPGAGGVHGQCGVRRGRGAVQLPQAGLTCGNDDRRAVEPSAPPPGCLISRTTVSRSGIRNGSAGQTRLVSSPCRRPCC